MKGGQELVTVNLIGYLVARVRYCTTLRTAIKCICFECMHVRKTENENFRPLTTSRNKLKLVWVSCEKLYMLTLDVELTV